MPDAPKSLYPQSKKDENLDECAQCFYQPNADKKPEPEAEKPAEDCAQCFYQPAKTEEK